jgi:Protein of unknown function (DUF4231)
MTINEWTSVEQLLSDWKSRIEGWQLAHYESAKHYVRLNYWLGIPVIIFTTFVGTSVFATLDKSVDIKFIKIMIGFISILAAVLTALQTFFRFSDRAEKHRTAAARYGVIEREIQQILAYPSQKKIDLLQGSLELLLDKLRDRIDALATEAPEIPQRVWESSLSQHKPASRLRSGWFPGFSWWPFRPILLDRGQGQPPSDRPSDAYTKTRGSDSPDSP